MTLRLNRVLEVVEVDVRAKQSSSWVQRLISYQQCTRFWTSPGFNREYLWNLCT